MATNPLLWVFVPDCPLAALLFAAALLLLAFNKRSDTFFLLSFVSGIKYSVWTIFTILFYWSFYVGPDNFIEQLINIGAHVLLFLEQFLLLGLVKVDLKKLSIVLGFLLANDLSDYLLGTHPLMLDYAVTAMFRFTVMLTLASAILVYYLIRRYEVKRFSASLLLR